MTLLRQFILSSLNVSLKFQHGKMSLTQTATFIDGLSDMYIFKGDSNFKVACDLHV